MTAQPPTGVSRRTLLSASVFGTAAAALGACTTTAAGTPPPSRGPDLVIGAALELSGPNLVVGTAQSFALSIIRDTINERGFVVGGHTRNVRLIVLDNQSDPVQAKKVTQSLIDNTDVSAIIGAGAADTSTVMAPLAEKNQIPMLSLSAAAQIVTPTVDRRYVFKLGPNASDVASRLVAAISSQGYRRIALMAANDPHGADGKAAMQTAARNGGLTIAGHVDLPPDGATPGDYQSQITTMMGLQAEAVVIWTLAPSSGLAARSLRVAGYRGRLFFDSGAGSDETLSAQNRVSVNGSYLISPKILGGTPLAVTTPDAFDQQDFYVRYTQEHGTFSGLAAYGGDALKLLVAAAVAGNTFDRIGLRDALETLTYDGLAGTYAFNTINHGGVEGDSLGLFAIRPSGWLEVT